MVTKKGKEFAQCLTQRNASPADAAEETPCNHSSTPAITLTGGPVRHLGGSSKTILPFEAKREISYKLGQLLNVFTHFETYWAACFKVCLSIGNF
jgi:hypothetical protein